MKPGDRVTVIAETDEYCGRTGEVLEVNDKGDLVVDIEVPAPPVHWRAVFKPHDVELVELAGKE